VGLNGTGTGAFPPVHPTFPGSITPPTLHTHSPTLTEAVYSNTSHTKGQ